MTAAALDWRMLVCHKHPVSARLHFLVPQQRGSGVLLPEALPALSVFAECSDDKPLPHPAMALAQLRQRTGLPELEVIGDYQVRLEIPGGILPVYLGALPGHDLCEPVAGTRWIAITDSIGMPWLDRELLRRAYEVLIG